MSGDDMTKEIKPELEGSIIGDELLRNATDIKKTNHCTKCGRVCDDPLTSTMCFRGCGRHFHRPCIPQKFRDDVFVNCAICDPSKRPEFCQRCGEPPNQQTGLMECVDKCPAFVHKYCLNPGTLFYRCGICTIGLV